MASCTAGHPVTDGAHQSILLVCFLEDGHEGLHYDSTDGVSWKAGKP